MAQTGSSPLNRPALVKDLIRDHDHAGALTPAERQLTSVLLRDYPVAGLNTVTKLAEAAGVSTPTVIRLARKLGYDGFPELQDALRREVSEQIKQPILKGDGWPVMRDDSPAFRTFARAVFDNLNHTIERLDPASFDAVAALLADPAVSVRMAGGRITRSNADYFFNHLQIIRPDVMLLPPPVNVWPQYLLDMGPHTALILFDIRRYEGELMKLAELAHGQGSRIVLFTDQWGSRISALADHVFNAAVEVPSSWDSTLAINLIVEALIAEVQARLGNGALARIERLEDMFSSTRIFRRPG